jgi:microcin C transport system substrate-binding protein
MMHRLLLAAFAFVMMGWPLQAEPVWRHGISLIGDLKYPPDFKTLDYVDPNAPKGGVARLGVTGSFDNFNPVIAEVRGNIAIAYASIYETLVARSEDELSSKYGLLAEAISYPDDYSSVTFRLRANARWHDGKPVTPEDVIWSFEQWKRLSPFKNKYLADVEKAEKTGERDITFQVSKTGNREIPGIIGEIFILPKHWWEAAGPDGQPRAIDNVTLEPPLGSGPYKVKSITPGRAVALERVKDYWGAEVPLRVGTNNFDELRYEYFRDPSAVFEGFKADEYDFRFENSSRNWMTSYTFPAVEKGFIAREEFTKEDLGIMQCFALNIRRDKFKDVRVRQALNLLFNFEEANKNTFFGLYKRTNSYFFGTELASSGLPQGRELEILNEVKDKVPAEVFTTPFTNPVNDTPDKVRRNRREALKLLNEAGWELKSGKLVSKADGKPFTIEFMAPTSQGSLVQRFATPYQQALERVGFTVSLRVVDDVQAETIERIFDFDVIALHAWGQSISPGNEQRDFWGSKAADTSGSRNVVGIKDPAIDHLIDKVIFAKDRADLVAATRALDRVLLWNHFVIPQWGSDTLRSARWDRFSAKRPLPRYGAGSFPTVWWFDPEKAARINN